MCGICGLINVDGAPASSRLVSAMADAMAHRGPDGQGVYVDGCVGLGHRRLAIIDLSPAGSQPMSVASGDFVITYNGELYNFQDLRIELQSLGCQFVSKTDTEIILHAYARWGEKCLSRFNGMFAFAIWDRRRRQLFLARDRYGIKPLYYYERDGLFLFASEQKAILTHPAVSRELNLEALYEYFTFQNFFTHHTLLRDILLFPAGSHAVVGPGLPPLRPVTYWDFDFREPETARPAQEYQEELDRLFRQAVNRQLVADVDVGAYLSGGIDSGAITAVAAGNLPYIKTFTCGFDLHSASGLELAFDEREKAEYLSYLYKTEHYEMVLKAGDMERVMPRLAWHLEEPRVGQSYPNFYVAQLASKFVKVVLAGTGGDELFAGYPWRYYRAVANLGFEDYVDKYYRYWQRLLPNTLLRKVFAPVQKEVEHVWTRDIFRNVFCNREITFRRPEDYVNHSLYFEAKTFLHGLLVVEDKLSMAHGLETRLPFLDNDLVDFAMSVPIGLKLANLRDAVRINENEPAKAIQYYSKTKDGKLILRQAFSHFVPKETRDAVKQGFSAPDASWFRGESIRYVRKILFRKSARVYEYLDKQEMLKLVMEHLEGKTNRRLFIWSLLNFEQWLRTYLP